MNHTERSRRKEEERLAETVAYIEDVLDAAEQSRIEYKQHIKQALIDLDHLDSSNSYVNILANANLLDTTGNKLHQLRSLKEKPYFARMDYKPRGHETADVLYIGKTSLSDRESHEPVIVDWRSPIANLYYEGQLGDVSYEANGYMYEGELQLKRQFQIEKRTLLDMRDIDLTARDQILQESLTTSADNRLKDIVSTIQAEQNQVIRAEMNRPMIVQGVAGSGKTTIALHRMAYYIYQFAEDFDPSELMILAPNHLFLDYVSEVLPELGVDQVTQTTFIAYATSILGNELRFVSKDQRLQILIDGPDHHEQWIASFKGSKAMKCALDRYIGDVVSDWLPDEDIRLDRYTLMSRDELRTLFVEEYTYLPPYQRLSKIKEVLKMTVKQKADLLIREVEEIYDNKIDQVRNRIKDTEDRRKRVVRLWDKREAHLEKMKLEKKRIVPDFTKQLPRKKTVSLVKDLLTKKEVSKTYFGDDLSEDNISQLVTRQRKLFKTKELDLEDAAILLYVEQALFGTDQEKKYKNIFIDEAQDYSYLELFVLRKVSQTSLFTILGDLSQGIHGYRAISDWNQVIEDIFPNANYKILKKSYRTTVEIMEKANCVIQLAPYKGMVLAEPVVRHDKEPEGILCDTQKEAMNTILDIYYRLTTQHYQSFAVITKTGHEAELIADSLRKQANSLTVELLDEHANYSHADLVVLPSYLSKGLEFDVVMIYTDQEPFKENSLDVKLLYVSMTRALHRLFVLYNQENPGIIQHSVAKGE
ncbi:RNA polymerase recycling motor HelD [Salisediminibacterium selenitireducens]|uniref:Superfamily I DNA and RNA helicase-like protein n=1 Tax=Bacillus selenitireducens (strain ATCC 700615 / DSM 15326 / MLS10) TaxID=439292 RepID=D6XZ85_BACIE|nr:RNA polymerase recycling motor HelD [Salisediminibacterium selenitireducens]ADI00370.1 Superfamily I DNA and RNA helicase-like protein [[Bacillus] selenitireducens MLS10]